MLYLESDAELKAEILAGCSKDEDERLGVEIMFRSLAAPMKQVRYGCVISRVWLLSMQMQV